MRETFVPLSSLRLKPKLARIDTYAAPSIDYLAQEIVDSKRRLDAVTLHEKIIPAPACLESDALQPTDLVYRVPPGASLPLPRELSHRIIAGRHLWIGVHDGTVLVLDDAEDELFRQLCDGVPPTLLSKHTCDLDEAGSATTTTSSVYALIARLARAGFIRGIQGYTDVTIPNASKFLRIHLTQRCNLTCVHCYADSSPHVSSEGELPQERWRSLIEEFALNGGERVLFTGGEALVYNGCLDLMERADFLGLHVTLFTNGILVPRFIERIAGCADEVQVSVDGPTANANDPIRGKGSFDHATRAIDDLVARGVPVRVSTVVMRSNWESIQQQYIDFARRWAGANISFKINYGLMEHGRGEEVGEPLDINETRPLVDKLMRILHPQDSARIARRTQGCGYAEQVVVAPNGDIHPCHLLDGAIAHIDDTPLIGLLGRLQEVQVQYDVDHNVGCSTCDIRHLCGGTCRVDNGKQTGNRRVTYCSADEKLRKLEALAQTFQPT